MDLSFHQLREANVMRCVKFFGAACANWTPAEWLMAATGKLGELANLLKKCLRGDFTIESQREELGKEIADVITYLDLLADHLKIDLAEAMRQKFNEVSRRRNADITL